MELKTYLAILLKKWWIVIPTFLITLTSGIVFTYTQTPIYSATTTYVVGPSPSIGDVGSYTYKLDTLSGRSEIATTFVEIARSDRVKNNALASLSLDSVYGYDVSGKLRSGTNIIEITVEGPDPVITQKFTNAIGVTIEQYIQGLYEIFTLIPLDEAPVPTSPTSPNIPFNLSLSATLGLMLGAGLAFLSEYLQSPLVRNTTINIIDEETGVYNKDYFTQRLNEEMVRARRNRYPLSLALMRIENLSLLKGTGSVKARSELLRQVAVLTTEYLKEEDIVSYLEDDIFGLLLPDMTGENAKAFMEYLQTRMAWTPFESSLGMKFNLKGIIGITTYNHNGASRDELISIARRALDLADVEEDGKAFLITNVHPQTDNNQEMTG